MHMASVWQGRRRERGFDQYVDTRQAGRSTPSFPMVCPVQEQTCRPPAVFKVGGSDSKTNARRETTDSQAREPSTSRESDHSCLFLFDDADVKGQTYLLKRSSALIKSAF